MGSWFYDTMARLEGYQTKIVENITFYMYSAIVRYFGVTYQYKNDVCDKLHLIFNECILINHTIV